MRGAHVVAARRRLQCLEHVGIGLVGLAALAELEVAGVFEARAARGGGGRARDCLLLELVEADPTDRPRRAGKSGLDEVTVEPERLEGLSAAVAGDVGDPELRHHLEHAVLDRLLEAHLCLGRRRPVAPDPVALGQGRDRLERQPRAHRLCPEAEQASDVMHLPRLVALDEQGRERAQPGLDEVVMHNRGREQDRHRRPLGRRVGIGDQQHPVSLAHSGLRGLCKPRARICEPLRGIEAGVDADDCELVERGREEEEALELDSCRVFGRLHEQRPTRPEQRRERHSEPLANVVDRGIRHLREPLAEVAEERPRTAGERRERGVVAHRRSRLVPMSGRRTHDHGQLLARVAKQHMPRSKLFLRRRDRLSGRRLPPPFFEPASVRARIRKTPLDRIVLLEAALRVDGEHLTRPEPSTASTRSRRHVEDTRLGGTADEVAGDDVAKRTQAVPVESGADDAPVGEDDPGRAVPRLDEPGVEAMEVAHLRVELGVSLPGGRNEHRECVPRVAAAAHQQLERVVEHARVRARFFEYGSVDAQRQRAGTHPVDVAPNCVDLPVVAEEPERLRSLPGRLGIRREALVEDAERNLEGRVAQVGVERSELVGGAERLVDNRAKRERGDVEVFAAVEALAGAECSRLDDVGIVRRRLEERLLDRWRGGPGRGTERIEVDRH